MKTKIIILTAFIVGIFLFSFVSANLFTNVSNWITGKPKIEPYKPAFNISNNFNTNKVDLNRRMIFNKLRKINPRRFKHLKRERINLIQNYFKINSQGITRFSNEK